MRPQDKEKAKEGEREKAFVMVLLLYCVFVGYRINGGVGICGMCLGSIGGIGVVI